MRRGLALALLLLAVAASGCGRSRGKDSTEPGKAEEPRIPVAVANAELATMADHVTVTGTIRAQREADISSQLNARVLEVTVREGDAVRQGQALIKLDP
ncbi:MAG: biotin/lipoyl-binding protein, partial [Armatimonadetes bacterium]|nr:biotin/lipoyl-binding protein [Armatimonadota bacterium]